jgi:hypothetical protein
MLVGGKSNRIWRIVLFLSAGLLAVQVSSAEAGDPCAGIGDRISHGEVLWTENAIVVQGTAAPNLSDPDKPISAIKREAQRAATLDAYRRAGEILAGIRLTADRVAADRPEIVSRLQAYIRNPQICRTKFYADGGVDIVVKVHLRGDLVKALLPSAGTRVAAAESAFTGLVVDAGRLAFAPALSPRFLAADGSVLFSQASVKKSVLASSGAVRYVTSAEGIPGERVGRRPLQVEAVALGSLSPSDLVLEESAVAELQTQPAYLGDGRVVVITRPAVPLDCKDLAATVTDQRVDWTRNLVLARGTGRANFSGQQDESVRLRMMERAAEVDAQRRLLQSLLGLKVESRRTLAEIPGAQRVLQGVVHNAVRCGAKYYRDGTAEVVMAAPIDGRVFEAGRLGRSAPSPSPAAGAKGPTGLIVDATALSVDPLLAPGLAAGDGTALYHHTMVARGWIQQHGPVAYHASLDKARSDPRVGDRPLILKAVRVNADSNQLIVEITDPQDARLAEMTEVLRQGRVVIATQLAPSG